MQLTGGFRASWAAVPIALIFLVSPMVPGLAHGDGLAKVTSDVLLYTDTDSVLVFSPQFTAHRELDDDGGKATARVTLDAISAASVDVISNATDRFSEVRTAVDLSVSKAFSSYLPSLSYRLSSEPDYTSHGFGVGLKRRLAGADTVLAANYGIQLDTIGRVDTPKDIFSESLTSHVAEISVTQVLSTEALIRVVYSLTVQNGYMEKPYRSVPLFAPGAAASAASSGMSLNIDTYDQFRLAFRPPESVPDNRYRHALAARLLHYEPAFDGSIRLDYRFYADSWGITGHTFEPALRHALSERWRLDFWTRFFWQSSASFWQRTYVVQDMSSIPEIRTMDRSLSSSWHFTGGARAEWVPGAFSAYLEISPMYSAFTDHLLIGSRFALISQGGIRWDI